MKDLTRSTFMLAADQQLSSRQEELKERIFNFIKEHHEDPKSAVFIIEGEAGTGKSLLLATLYEELQKAVFSREPFFDGWQNKLLVNHNEMLKIYWELAKNKAYLRKKDFMKPTPFINAFQKSREQADVVFIDEAHLLLTKPDPFNKYTGQNQLTDILKLAKVIVLVFDPHQVIKLKSWWQPEMLATTLKGHLHETADLSQQQRVMDPQVTAWIDGFLAGELLTLPAVKDYDLQIFDDGLPLYEMVKKRNDEVGLSRVLATADFPFTVMDDKIWYVTAGELRLPWDKINFTDVPWAERSETINEVGSIYTIQGFDLNYAGVIIGPSIRWEDEHNCLVVDDSRYEDREAFKKRQDEMDTVASKQQIMLDALNILLKRGRYGLYLYACDENLRKRLLLLQAEKKSGNEETE